MKRLFFFLFLLATSLPAFSQHFDWVTQIDGYDNTSSNVGNIILGSMTDSNANLYIYAAYGYGATLCGVDLPSPSSSGWNMVVAKISPAGELLWHREGYGYRTGPNANCMVPLGDTAMMVCFNIDGPGYQEWMEVFGTRYGSQYSAVDSLFVGKDSLEFYDLHLCCLVTFNLDGEIVESHYVARTFLDADGNPFTGAHYLHPADSLKIWVDPYFSPDALTVDREGNIIMARAFTESLYVNVPCDTCLGSDTIILLNPANGGVSGVRYYVDGNWLYDFIVPFPADYWNLQMIKFTPDMDSVIFCQYVGYDTVGHGETRIFDMEEELPALATDPDGNIYLCGTVESFWNADDPANYRDILLDSLRPDMRIHIEYLEWDMGYLLKYSPDGTLQWVHHPRFKQVAQHNSRIIDPKGCYYHSVLYDDSDSSLYILTNFAVGFTYDTALVDHRIIFSPYDTVQHRHKGAGFVHLRASDAGYLGSGCAPAPDGAGGIGYRQTLAVENNNVVIQVAYGRQLIGIDTVFQHNWPGQSGSTLAMVHFDNMGHVVNVVDFGNNDTRSRIYHCLLRDSILYMTGALSSNAYFGDITLYTSQNLSYIVKYVDTAYTKNYVYVDSEDTTGHTGGNGDTNDIRITLVEGGNAFVAYPNPFRQRVNIKVEGGELKVESGVAIAWLTDMQGRREEVRLTPAGNGKYTLDLTSRPQATYLLTLTTATGKTHTIRLLKQSDVFGK